VTVGAAYGDALLAAVSVGLAEPTARWNPVAEVVCPDQANRETYDRLYEVYRELYPATRSQAHVLARMQGEESGRV
jgi:xylulokinase